MKRGRESRDPSISGTLLYNYFTSEKGFETSVMSSTKRAAFHVEYAVNPTVFLDSSSIGLKWH